MAASEAYERATRAFLTACEVAEDEDDPLTERQRVLVGTALLSQFVGMEETLRGMARTSDLIRRIGEYTGTVTRLGDEMEAWLAEQEEGK